MQRILFLILACSIVAACAGGAPSEDPPPAAFDANAPSGMYEFTTVTLDGQTVTGNLLVEGEDGAYRARLVAPGLPTLELPTVRTEPGRMTLEGPAPEGVLRVDLAFRGADFAGQWEMMGQQSELTGRKLSEQTDFPGVEAALQFGSWDELHAGLVARARERAFSGVVLVANGDEVQFHRAYGVADQRGMKPIMPDTRFNIGSLDKLFTSVVILQLAQEGRLQLDAPVSRYVDDLGVDPGGRITIRQLLQHTSGLGDYLTHPEFRRSPEHFRTVGDYMRLVRGQPLQFEPGEGQRYSNSGFVVLGAVIEAVTGRPYHEVVRERVLAPAGMTSTGPSPDERSAVGYTRTDRGELKSTQDRWPLVGSPAGGGYSSAADLHRFLRALLSDRLLEARYTDMLLRNFEDQDEPIDRRGPWDVEWGGGAAGLNASVGYDARTGRIVAVLANLDPPAATTVGRAILMNDR